MSQYVEREAYRGKNSQGELFPPKVGENLNHICFSGNVEQSKNTQRTQPWITLRALDQHSEKTLYVYSQEHSNNKQ